ncbi:MAG: hypothetical protein FJ265_20485, partial [Planctomycetes bacterium]|nr:hypothetical protein [Planctomycetota bacterium]
MPSTLIHLVAVLPDGQPAAGAEVLFWPPRSQAQRDRDEQATEGMRDAELAVRGRGRGARTDQDGTAAIEIDEETPICVRHGDHLGETSFDNECGPGPLWCRVELQRDVALRVQVVDESGAPCVGNEVNCWTVARTLAFRGPTCILDLGCTDADGR